MIALLRTLWLFLLPAPYLVARDGLVGTREVALVAAVAYLAGWGLFWLVARRDPHAQRMREFAATRTAAVALLLSLLALQFIAAWMSVGTALVVLILACDALLFAWWRGRDGAAVAASVGNGILLLVSLGLVLALAEVAFRLPGVVARTGGNNPGINRWSAENYDKIWERNPQRLRSFHAGEPKPAGTRRIVVAGDSFSWGYLIADTEDTWPYVVERTLRDAGQPLEVINLGKNGNSVFDNLQRIEDLGWLYEPDLVVLQFTLNDPIGGAYGDYFDLWPLLPGLNSYFDQRSYLYSFLQARWRGLQMAWRFPDGEAALYRDSHEPWRRTRQAFADLAADGRRRGVPVVIALFPLYVPGGLDDDAYPFVEAHRAVAEAAAAADIPLIDVRPAFAATGRDGASWWALPCDSHPDEEGHALAGEVLAPALAGYLPPAAGDAQD